jgi:Family of unknown function (DUF6134)
MCSALRGANPVATAARVIALHPQTPRARIWGMTNPCSTILMGLSLGCMACPAAQAADPARSWHFSVLLDGKPIGEHDFAVVPQGDEVIVDTRAHFQVKAAFIPLYHYDHQDHEVWRNGCLLAINARTDDNGRILTVQGALQGAVFRLQGSHGALSLPACIKTFAYWDQSLLNEPRLLNSQTGEFQSVMLIHDGAQHCSLRAPKLDIQLWYSDAGEWLALESRLESGKRLRYEIAQR